ncbi:hypothetical protein GIB67_033696 [Kingdonia uniflora]|uniref:CW-type domain-containing protein n=1 Tax=Kingdonia uniflora TaxID=39325 RepID=A0A7J7P4V5_9MAGN|nr:hypothetical protein GIB67_033696 [Kingdonia uniflora]
MVSNQNNDRLQTSIRTHPSFLNISQGTHVWMFSAIAELVDNSRDAKATTLDISVEDFYSKKDGKSIPMMAVIDDGHGMPHQEINKMLSLGHTMPDGDDPNYIGRFGVGFKTGAMRIGQDAIVITQTTNTRSIGFLSQSFNSGKDNLEVPIVSYRRQGSVMEVDTTAQSEARANYNLAAIKDFSPFDEYFIGEKLGLFHGKVTGTQIYVWNLEKWGAGYFLEWKSGNNGNRSMDEGNILIRSRRLRSRPGKISKQVPLDYSLRSYMEVIFLDPRMKIFVQGSLVKARPLAKSLHNTVVLNETLMEKPVQLTLGRCQLEYERKNSGIFLYWHGRLIEAYKRVGNMAHNADTGRGVIGVIDVTNLMYNGKNVLVLNNKQGFQDCEEYAELEEWLSQKLDEYWDENYDALDLGAASELYKPDHEWVQCDKCRKWRILSSGFDNKMLPQEWYTFMSFFIII